MKYKSHQGWYKLRNPQKFIKVIDEHMQSSRDGYLLYKSSLEKKMMQYCDLNKFVKCFSLEPFAIPYVKPTDGKVHRYYVDFYLEFCTGHKVLVEIKTFAETRKPLKPKRLNAKTVQAYNEAMQTFLINMAKWKYAKEFCNKHSFEFLILTENELK